MSTLYQVILAVRPTTEHPRFFEVQFGELVIWLFAKSSRAAAERAAIIALELPYEFIERSGDKIPTTVFKALNPPPGMEQEFELAQAAANQVGIAFLLYAAETGADERQWLKRKG